MLWSIYLIPFRYVSTEGKILPFNLMEGGSADYSACIMENAPVVMALTTAYLLEVGFGHRW